MSKFDGIGDNPFQVNIITFTGHGITFEGEAIAIIPQYEDSEAKKMQQKQARFINFSGWARKFASVKNTLNFFILSMCRSEIDKGIKQKIHSINYSDV